MYDFVGLYTLGCLEVIQVYAAMVAHRRRPGRLLPVEAAAATFRARAPRLARSAQSRLTPRVTATAEVRLCAPRLGWVSRPGLRAVSDATAALTTPCRPGQCHRSSDTHCSGHLAITHMCPPSCQNTALNRGVGCRPATSADTERRVAVAERGALSCAPTGTLGVCFVFGRSAGGAGAKGRARRSPRRR